MPEITLNQRDGFYAGHAGGRPAGMVSAGPDIINFAIESRAAHD